MKLTPKFCGILVLIFFQTIQKGTFDSATNQDSWSNFCSCFNFSPPCTMFLSNISLDWNQTCFHINPNLTKHNFSIDELDNYFFKTVSPSDNIFWSINASFMTENEEVCSQDPPQGNTSDSCINSLKICMHFTLKGNDSTNSTAGFHLRLMIQVNRVVRKTSTPTALTSTDITVATSTKTTEETEITTTTSSTSKSTTKVMPTFQMSTTATTSSTHEHTTMTKTSKATTGSVEQKLNETMEFINQLNEMQNISTNDIETLAGKMSRLIGSLNDGTLNETLIVANEVAESFTNILRRTTLWKKKDFFIKTPMFVVQISLFNPNMTFNFSSEQSGDSGIIISPEILKKFVDNKNADKEILVVIVEYKSSYLFPSKENVTQIFSIDIGRNNTQTRTELPKPLQLKFLPSPKIIEYLESTPKTFQDLNSSFSTTCVYWNFSKRTWLTDGCSLKTGSLLTCECNHTTNYALIVNPNLQPDFVLDIVSKLGFALSIVGLVATLVIHILFKELRKRRSSLILMHICFNLCMGYIIFLAGAEHTKWIEGLCLATAFLLHVFFLAAWGWMTVYSYDVYVCIVKVFNNKRRYFLRKYGGAAYVMSLIVPVISITVGLSFVNVSKKPIYLSKNICWLSTYPLLLGFFLPIGIMLCFNQIVFVLVFRELFEKSKDIVSSAVKRTLEQQFIISVTMICFTGLAWIFAFLLLASDIFNNLGYEKLFSWLFVVFNSLQGFGIFFLTLVKRKEARIIWWSPIQKKLSSALTNLNVSFNRSDKLSDKIMLDGTYRSSIQQNYNGHIESSL